MVGRVAKPPLLCELGRHKTDALAVWNDGYYFSQCARCGQDLVRTAFGRWTVPRGFRVVWAAQPPQATPPVHLVPEARAGDTSPGSVETPVVGTAAIDAQAPTVSADDPVPHAEARRPIAPVVDAEPRKRMDPREAVGERSLRYLFPSVQDRDGEPAETAVPAVFVAPPTSEPHVVVEPTMPVLEAPVPDEQPMPMSQNVSAEDASAPAAEEVEADAVPMSKPLIPDFMDGGAPLEVPYDLTTGRILPPEERPGTLSDVEVPKAVVPPAPSRARVGERVRTAAMSARAFVDGGPSPTTTKRAAAIRSRAFVERHAGLVAATVFGAFVVVAATIDRSDAPAPVSYRPLVRDAEPARVPAIRPQRVATTSPTPVPRVPVAAPDPRPFAAAPETPPAATRTPQPVAALEADPTLGVATVTASILRCRAKPDNDSETVRKLTRGVSVQLVRAAAGPGWVSVTQNGKRCWVSERYLSTTRRA